MFVPAARAIPGMSPPTSAPMEVFRGTLWSSAYGPVGACTRRKPHSSQMKPTAPVAIQSSESPEGLPQAVRGASCRTRTRSLAAGIHWSAPQKGQLGVLIALATASRASAGDLIWSGFMSMEPTLRRGSAALIGPKCQRATTPAPCQAGGRYIGPVGEDLALPSAVRPRSLEDTLRLLSEPLWLFPPKVALPRHHDRETSSTGPFGRLRQSAFPDFLGAARERDYGVTPGLSEGDAGNLTLSHRPLRETLLGVAPFAHSHYMWYNMIVVQVV